MQQLVELMADDVPYSICDLVCDGKCKAIGSLTQTKRQMCVNRIKSFINAHLDRENFMESSLYEFQPRKYCKRPVEVRAIRFIRSNFEAVKEFTNGAARDLTIERCINGKCTCVIPTLEGDHIATEGDFIIEGVHGEYYPCKPDIFFKTYDLAENDS